MPKFGLQLVTGPQAEPVTLAQAKQHLRVDFTNDDTLITTLISAAREQVEGILQRAIFNQTWVLSLDQFPFPASFSTYAPNIRENYLGNALFYDWTAIVLPLPRLSSVTSITYRGANGQPVALDPSSYAVDSNSEPARIVPGNGGSWPYPATYTPGSIKITFVTGSYGNGTDTNTCPASIVQAILLIVGHLYANREAVTAQPMTTLPLAVDALLSPYKFHGFAL